MTALRQEQRQSPPEYTAEDVERLARFMGWSVVRGTDDVIEAMMTPFPLVYMDSDDEVSRVRHVMDPPTRWSPFTDANADLEVLERAREGWRGPLLTLDRLGYELRKAWSRRQLETPPIPLHYSADSFLRYEVGDYSRAVLEVLRSTEGETAP